METNALHCLMISSEDNGMITRSYLGYYGNIKIPPLDTQCFVIINGLAEDD